METLLEDKLQRLGDLELAVLVSLISGQHSMFSTAQPLTKDLRDELRLVCTQTFRLQTAVLDCSVGMTVDEFSEAILVDVIEDYEDALEQRHDTHANTLSTGLTPSGGRSPNRLGSFSNGLDERRIADVIIAAHLDRAGPDVQVQALELLRSRRIFTRTAMHLAPRDFLFIVVLSEQEARLTHHLNDMFAMSHFHAEEDGFPHLEDMSESEIGPIFAEEDIRHLRTLAEHVRLTGEMRAYLHNVVVFLRMSRYVKGGVTAAATRHLRAIATALAPLHGLTFIAPSLVALAARKVYPHRLVLATAETERSLQWGSDPQAVKDMLEGVTIEDVIEDTLAAVETPL